MPLVETFGGWHQHRKEEPKPWERESVISEKRESLRSYDIPTPTIKNAPPEKTKTEVKRFSID